MQNSDRRILRKIVEEVDYLENLLSGVELDSFLSDETMERAASMIAINIGELAKHLSDAFYERHPETELRYAARTRDVYAHGYFTLSFETVYKTAREDYPRLRAWITATLKSEPGHEANAGAETR